MADMALTKRDFRVLDLEGSWWVGLTAPANKREAIAAAGLSANQYYAVLRAVVERDEALAYAPLVVRRVRKAQAERRRVRFEGRRAGDPRR